MGFRKIRSLGLPYIKQGMIYFTCQNYCALPQEMQHKIHNLCLACGGEHHQALFEVMTTQNSIVQIAMKHHIDESYLYRLRKRFYERW